MPWEEGVLRGSCDVPVGSRGGGIAVVLYGILKDEISWAWCVYSRSGDEISARKDQLESIKEL